MVSTMFGTTKAQSVLRSKRLNAERGKVLFYLWEYTSGRDFSFSKANQIISNKKRSQVNG